MMNSKLLMIVSCSVAVVALSASVAFRSVKRAEAARFAAERAASEEEIATRTSRKAEAEQKAAEAAARAAEAKKVEGEAAKERAIAEQKTQTLATTEAEALRRKAEAEAEAAKARAKAQLEKTAAAKAEAAKAAAEAAKARDEAAKAKYEAEVTAGRLETEKAKAETAAQAAKTLELRKIDFEMWQTRLVELEQDLAERERAVRPDKTTADLVWVAEREPDVIGETGTVRRAKAAAVRPEDDLTLPLPTRRLAKCERRVSERAAELEAASSNAVVTALERLYVRACEEHRVVDADYYARSIRQLYPQWIYVPTDKKGEAP